MKNKKSWLDLYKDTENLPPSKGLVGAMRFAPKTGNALDLGAGAGKDSRYLLENGYRVTAVDSDPASKKFLQKLPDQNKLTIVTATLQDFDFEKYNLITSWFTLSFLPEEDLIDVFSKIKESLNPGGIFTGNVFGVDDEWSNSRSEMSFLTMQQTKELLDGLDVLILKESKHDGFLANGKPKHWHVFIIVARKK